MKPAHDPRRSPRTNDVIKQFHYVHGVLSQIKYLSKQIIIIKIKIFIKATLLTTLCLL